MHGDRVLVLLYFYCFKQKTAYEMRISDWSSDVCSSDLSARRRSRILDDFALLARAKGVIVAESVVYRKISVPMRSLLQATAIVGALALVQFGRASCRERECQYV